MDFTLLPAVDVADGRVARVDGAVAASGGGTIDPVAMARRWESEGAEWIHLVDLDAALGRGSNSALLTDVIGSLDVDVELSGGIRDDASLDAALATGCSRAVLATSASADPPWCARVIAEHGERVAVSLDVRAVSEPGGTSRYRLVPRGGNVDVGDLWETLERFDGEGCVRYVVTETSRDGTLTGPDVALYRSVADVASGRVIASGGISSIDDLVTLAEMDIAGKRLEGAVVGTALLAGRFTLPTATEAVRRAGRLR